MSVWLTIPSKRPPEEAEPILKLWRERGYKIALWRDDAVDYGTPPCDYGIYGLGDPYPGYATAVNRLIDSVMDADPSAEWFIAAGDDTEPHPDKSAEEIAGECLLRFSPLTGRDLHIDGTFGVMQPTGDRWHEGVGGFENAPIDRVAGSPWIGREFARRMYQGNGPYWPEYTHCFVDEELQHVAEKLGVFWQRRDLTHLHRNWARGSHDKEIVPSDRMPEFLKEANSAEHWRKYKALFEARKAAGFPGHEPAL